MEEFLPRLFNVSSRLEGCKGLANNFVRIGYVRAGNSGKQLEFGNATEERGDQGLDRDERAVACQGITPGFKKVRGGQMPMAFIERLVLVIAETNYRFGFLLRVQPVEIGWSRVN